MSYHGTEAWKLEWNASNEEAGGILYYSDYTYIYIGFNMNWMENTLALPNIPGNHKWKLLMDTSMEQGDNWISENEKELRMPPRTIKIITAKASKEDFNESFTAF